MNETVKTFQSIVRLEKCPKCGKKLIRKAGRCAKCGNVLPIF